jgi:uncharacterized membrane protein YhaH (DUF805 family)
MSDDRTNHDDDARGQQTGANGTPPWGDAAPRGEQQPPQYGQQPPAYGQQPPAYGQQPPAYGQPGQFAGGYGSPDGGYQQFPGDGEPPLWAPWYGISFPQAFVRFWKKYVRFDGRASRSEFWWFVLWMAIINTAISIIGSATANANGDSALETTLSAIWGLATIVPQIALQARRLHDTNRSGWWMLIGLIPIVGWIILIVWSAQRSVPEGARFDQPGR